MDLTLQEFKRTLLSKIAKSEMRTYADWKAHTSEAEALTKAKLAGKMIQSIAREARKDPNLKMKDLSMAEIEFYSREFEIDSKQKEHEVSRESVKRYLQRYLGKDEKDLNEFSVLRYNWKTGYIGQKQSEKKGPRRAYRFKKDLVESNEDL